MFKKPADSSVSKDQVFSKSLSAIPEFQFDERVTQVFEDMIKRSVPGYDLLIYFIGLYAQVFVKEGTKIYDLGCSTGVATCIMSSVVNSSEVTIIAVDNSRPMIDQCKKNIANIESKTAIDCRQEDVTETSIEQASMVVLNLTLQFVDPAQRIDLLHRIYDGLEPGGILVLSEKVVFDDAFLNKSMIDLHQAFKKTQGYSELEISQKRTSLENIMIPDTIEVHVQRLKDVGFSQVMMCFQCLNFVSFLAIK